MKKVLFFLFILNFFVAPLRANIDSLLAGIEKISSLIPVEPPRNYVSNDLFVMINGGAETYLEYGFIQALDASYSFESTKRIGLQIYEMANDGAAFGVITSSRNEGDSKLQIGDFSVGNEYYLMVQKSRFFFIASADESSKEIQDLLKKIVTSVSANINENGVLPEIVTKCLSAGFNIENLKYIKGKIALSGNYFFAHKEIFNTPDAVCINDGDCTLFIFQYSGNQSALLNLKRISEELISSGRYTQFHVEENKFNCIDKNSKHIIFRISNNYIIATIGKELREDKMKKVLLSF